MVSEVICCFNSLIAPMQLHSTTALYLCTLPLNSITALYHCTLPLHSTVALYHCTLAVNHTTSRVDDQHEVWHWCQSANMDRVELWLWSTDKGGVGPATMEVLRALAILGRCPMGRGRRPGLAASSMVSWPSLECLVEANPRVYHRVHMSTSLHT